MKTKHTNKLFVLLISIMMIVTLVACGDKCEQHIYDDCADIEYRFESFYGDE